MAKKILIVDDEPDVIVILGLRLKIAGFEVITGSNGFQAIELAQKEKPDLIILDVKMPGMDGYTTFKKLRDDPETSSISVVFFTALQPQAAQAKVEELGADGFLSKTADPQEVLSIIRKISEQTVCRSCPNPG